MESLLNFLPVYLQKGKRDLKLSDFAEACKTHQCLALHQKKNSGDARFQNYISTVNSKLNNAETRINGALLLEPLIEQCSTEIFAEYCVSWTQQLMRMIQSSEGKDLGCKILGSIIVYSSQIPELQRQMNTFIGQIVNLLCDDNMKLEPNLLDASLACLQACMDKYSGPCGPSKLTIENYLSSLIDHEDSGCSYSSRAEWTLCFSLLPRVGGGGPQGSTHKANWSTLFTQAVGSLHQCIDGLYSNLQEIQTFERPATQLKLSELKNTNPLALLQVYKKRFVNLCGALGRLLTEPFPVAKNFSIDNILDLISRVLAVSTSSLVKRENLNLEHLTLASILPTLHGASLDLLISLIGSARGQLILRSSTVMNFFVRVLQGSLTPLESRTVGSYRPYGDLRCKAYKGLQQWLTASRAACGASKYGEDLVKQALSDVVVHRDTVKLHQDGKMNSNNKKQKGKASAAPTAIYSKTNFTANEEVCCAALQLLASLFTHYGSWMKPTVHKEVQVVVLGILTEILKDSDTLTLLPYNNSTCRAELYNLLRTLVLCPSPRWPSPIHYAVALFNEGVNDPSFEVSRVCAESLAAIKPILRPRGPTLNFPIDSMEIKSLLPSTEQSEQRKVYEAPEPVVAVPVQAAKAPAQVMELPVQAVELLVAEPEVEAPPIEVEEEDEEEDVSQDPEPITESVSKKIEVETPLDEDRSRTDRKRPSKAEETFKPKKVIVDEMKISTNDEDLDLMLATFVDAPSDSP